MREALATMLRMQDRINTQVHPEWIAQEFAWHRAIWVECAELVDHYGYKWWKRQEHDIAQVQLEVVDIWHFGLSALFTADSNIEALAQQTASCWPQHIEATGVLEAAERLAAIAAGERRFSIAAFAALLAAADMGFGELYRQYLGKNVLNRFRQDHGYKDGSYRKQWAGREDNEHLAELLAELLADPVAGPLDDHADMRTDAEARLYEALSQRYAGVA
ncbi:MAG: dUTP diphosphatase [Halieaceae bacterium]|jgi:dimeric dUTPase (all-alpha-NTP-PPase superfamily)|nr:dUTP diphosphatase [Halieaceae bacterium]